MALFLELQSQLTGILNEGTSALTSLWNRGSSYAKPRVQTKSKEKVRNLSSISKKKKDISVFSKELSKISSLSQTTSFQRDYSSWTESHKSLKTFHENKYGVFKKPNETKRFFKLWDVLIPKRYFTVKTSKFRIMELEEYANQNMYDAPAQAEYLKTIVNEDPEYVIRRYESGEYAINDDVNSIYMKALLLTNRMTAEQALQHFSSKSNSSRVNREQNGLKFFGGTDEEPLHVVVKEKKNSLFRYLGIIAQVAIFVTLVLLIQKGRKIMDTDVNPEDQSERTYKFSDVRGCDEAIQELQEVVGYLQNPEKFESVGAKLPRGLLLIGPPGTGKTLIARAIAGEANVPFFFMSGSEFDEMYVGVGAARMRKLFDTAKQNAPCIVFIDEIDAVGSKRTANEAHPYSRMTLNQMLIELDGFKQAEGVIVVGATNFPEVLDKALTRPGRFDSKVFVPLPDVRGREQILDLYLSKTKCGHDVNSEVLARGTPGLSGADLANLVNQAGLRAVSVKSKLIMQQHLEWAKEKILMGPENKSRVIDEASRKLVAYHEGGHVIVSLFTPDAEKVHKVTIIPRGQALGYVLQLPEKDRLNWSKKQLLAKMDVCMGGRVAEELIFGEDSITTGASSDMQQATKLARAMVTKYGMSEKVGTILIEDNDTLSPELSALVEAEVKRLLDESYKRAKAILTKRSKEHKLLAEGLLKYETFNTEEVYSVIRGEIK